MYIIQLPPFSGLCAVNLRRRNHQQIFTIAARNEPKSRAVVVWIPGRQYRGFWVEIKAFKVS
jgi:hypothetical protein